MLFSLSFTFLFAAETVYIPDANFKAALISLGVDTNDDMEIEYAEALAVTSLDVSSMNISDLTGIEFFTNLTILNCYTNNLTLIDVEDLTVLQELRCFDNQLTSLDVSANTALVKLMCQVNELTALDVTTNTQLTHLYCLNNQLASIDVSNNVALQYFYCEVNEISSIDISANTNLKELICNNNLLTSMDVSNNPDLVVLRCHNNSISELDLTSNPDLAGLMCGGNLLTELDVSHNPGLKYLVCGSNQISSLNISVNTLLESIGLDNMPTLVDVCVWELPFPPADVTLDTTASPNAIISTDCIEEYVYIPDANFKAALLELGVDMNEDGEISVTEAQAIDSLDVHEKDIADLTGIEAFNNLIFLWCYDNQLTSLDISNLTYLTNLDCGGNLLTVLDVSTNTELLELRCYVNQLAALDISLNTGLTYIDCGSNLFTELNVSANTSLIQLLCYSSGLTALNISNNTNLEFLNISGIPTLETVCVWVLPFPAEGITVIDTDSPDVIYSECTPDIKYDVSHLKEINVYPNPAEDKIYINLPTSEPYAVSLFNISGVNVLSKISYQNQEHINVESLSAGLYFLLVQTEREVYKFKITIRKN